jgi:tripartite-type tricarboxylate transporter receptor subunit TctC
MKKLKITLAALGLAALAQFNLASAQAWPSKPIQMIVPQGAGGSTDSLARMVGTALGERLGQPVVIDNRAGAGGVIGVAAAGKAPADGYTFILGSNTTFAANAFLYASFPGDPVKDFAPLAKVADAAFALMVPASSPYKSVRDLVADAKARPGSLNYGYGTSSALLCSELFKAAAGVDITKVPYKASPQALTDLIGGQLQVLCEPLSSGMPNVRAGRLRALALAGARRSSLVPDLETAAEAGVPGMDYGAWLGFFIASATPKDIVARLSSELIKVLNDPAFADKIRGIGMEPHTLDAEGLGALHRSEIKKIAAIVKAAGIKAE